MNPLLEISDFVKMHPKTSVIFDLDSTLFCVSPRTQAILRELSSRPEFQQGHRELSEILRTIEVLPTDWGIRSAMERAGAKGTLDLFMRVRDFWHAHFFTNRFLEHDTIYPSANEYVKHLHSLGAEILYLTGRNDGAMREGTVKMLKRYGFPYFDDSRLYMKPNDVLSDEGYKVTVLKELIKERQHIWFFENEPVIIEQVRVALPQIRIVFVNSVHAGRAHPPKDLPTIGMSYREGLPNKPF
jgi:hypothetical protein